jgi:hypothetical protein
MLSIRLSTRQKKQLLILCSIMLLIWMALLGVIFSITDKTATIHKPSAVSPTLGTRAQTQKNAAYKKHLKKRQLQAKNAHLQKKTYAVHPQPPKLVITANKPAEQSSKISQDDHPPVNQVEVQKIQQAVQGINALIGQNPDYDSESEDLAQARQVISTLIQQKPQLAQTLIAQILEDPYSNTSAEVMYALGESQSPELEKMLADQLLSATDEEKVHLLGITQYWDSSSSLVVDSVLQSLQFSGSNDAQISALETLQSYETITSEAKQTATNLIASIVDSNNNVEVLSTAFRTLGLIATDPMDLQKPLEALNNNNPDLQSAALDAFSDTSITSDEIKEKLVSYAATQEDCFLYEQAITSLKNYTLTTDEKKLANVRVGECELSDLVTSNF